MDTNEAADLVSAATTEVEKETPVNLPTFGFDTFTEAHDISQDTQALNDLENQAHTQKVLLSSDAMRYFIAQTPTEEDRPLMLDRVIGKARTMFPSEDGWVVINLARMEALIEEPQAAQEVINMEAVTATPLTAGSLAEAIVIGNVHSAYEMISHRPMVALADATADLDALYRYRKGEDVAISELLKSESINLSIEKLQAAIVALTSALDGTYTDEESAVKMAIMKAVKAIAS